MIKENLQIVRKNIEKACAKSNRNVKDVKLICVSKTKPVDMIYEAIACNEKIFGENKVQELSQKYDIVNDPVEWHLIGHLQRNKVKQIVGKVKLIHSVDSIRLAQQIQTEFEKANKIAEILLEVNVAKEETKFGFMPEEVEAAVLEISKYKNIKIKGLMTIAPYVENAEDNRVHFAALNKILVDIRNKNIDNVSMCELSMGMTGDYEVAIEEGATYVRVGTGIFGSRVYN